MLAARVEQKNRAPDGQKARWALWCRCPRGERSGRAGGNESPMGEVVGQGAVRGFARNDIARRKVAKSSEVFIGSIYSALFFLAMRRYASQRTRKNRIPSAITYEKSASVAVIWSPFRPKRLKIIANIVVITIANGYHSINATRHCQNEFLNVMRRSGFCSIFLKIKPITTHRRGVVINISQYTKHLLLESLMPVRRESASA
jgi:hypothetical protein